MLYAGILSLCLFFVGAFASNANGQQLRAELAVTVAEGGATINTDLNYYNSKYRMFAFARLFIDEPDGREPESKNKVPLVAEFGGGPLFRHGIHIIGPLGGIDSKKRVIAGANYVTKLFQRTTGYLGYVNLATTSDEVNASRHRILFDMKKDQKIFLRLDWKTEGSRHEHCRVGAEFHTRIDKMNLPVYLEPFWDFAGKSVGLRVGTRL
jgi:hypothetical protein